MIAAASVLVLVSDQDGQPVENARVTLAQQFDQRAFADPSQLGDMTKLISQIIPRDRRTDAPEVIDRRLRDALSDMSHWDEFDYVIINDDPDTAVADLESVLAGDGHACSTENPALRQTVARIVG